MNMVYMVYNEFKINLLSAIAYRFGFISDILIFGGLQAFLFLSDSGTSMGMSYAYEEPKQLLLLGYIMWILACSCVANIGGEVYGEMLTGTFYHKLNSSTPICIIYIGKLVASLITVGISICVIVLFSRFVFHVDLIINLEIVMISLISIIGLYGLGLAIGGIAVMYKKTSSIVFLVELVLLMGTGVLGTGVNGNDRHIKLSPLGYGIDLIRKNVSGTILNMNDYLGILLVSGVYLGLGVVFFMYMINRAKRQGNLLHF